MYFNLNSKTSVSAFERSFAAETLYLYINKNQECP